MSGSASAPPKKLVFPPVAPPEPAAEPVVAPPIRRAGAFLPMAFGVLVIVGALAYLLIEREPVIEVIDLSAALNCPAGTEPASGRMHVTASTLNVRAGPSARADRLADRTLRKKATVTEECRGGDWSRVRLVDGRSGWVSNEYLAPAAVKN
jgi:uncharacterized protein YgiM (DUF1202 family)